MADIQTRLPVSVYGSDGSTEIVLATDATGKLNINTIAGITGEVSLAAGTNNIGDVDVLTLPGTVEADIGNIKTAVELIDNLVADEGTAIGSSTGVLMHGDDGTNRKNVLVDMDGHLQVDVLSEPAGATSKTDDSAFNIGNDNVTAQGALFDDIGPDPVDEGDIGIIRMSNKRVLYTMLRDGAGNERGANIDSNNNLQVILAANSGVDIGDVDVLSVKDYVADGNAVTTNPSGIMIQGDDGTNRRNLNVDSTGHIILSELPTGNNNIGDVDIASALPAGDNNIGNVDIASAIPAGDNNIGNVDIITITDYVADGSAVATNPLGIMIQGDDGTDRRNITVDTGGNLQVDVVSSIPSGSNNIGDVDIASIDDYVSDGGTVAANPFGIMIQGDDGTNRINLAVDSSGNLQCDIVDGGNISTTYDYAEDSVHGDTDSGAFVLAVRANGDVASAGSNGDYSAFLTDENGRLKVTDMPSPSGIVVSHGTVASVADTSTGQITYTAANGTDFYLKGVYASSSGGPCKVQVVHDDGIGGETILATGFYSSANPFIHFSFDQPFQVAGDGDDAIEVKITNNAGSAQDVYATVLGVEYSAT